MRYAIYKKINLLTDSVVEAVSYLKNKPESLSILSDCVTAILTIQNSLVANKIELSEISLFLEKVNKIIDCVEQGKDYIELVDELLEMAKRINEYCKKLEYRFKIAFFAELGSKWDAMDSVYRAFNERIDCDVTVVLSPIFRAIKLPNGEVKSDIIYEDYLTPMGIPHIPFQSYDIKKELPDMAFTSQPYESVMPEQFWAENVVPYTKLVYLPYFTSRGIVNDEEKAVQCGLPTQELAWRVMCQSKRVKEIYSNYFPTKGENIIATGLPKWDWVVNMNERDIKFPKEWEKLKGKKIILKNQHYIFKPEKLLEVLRNSINYFNDSDVGFLYRFHPMTETMFNVYYPKYKEEWEKVKREIENSSNVAIDYNTTYDCAFKYSDILLTGHSSIIFQYLLTKKPIVTIHYGSLDKHKKYDTDKNAFIRETELYSVETNEEGYELCKKVLNDDYEYDKRMKLIEACFPNIDGKIGDRIATELIEELKKEEV